MTTLDQVKDCLNEGRLDEALVLAKTCVREGPSDLAARATLVSLFALQGDLERALQQFKAQQSLGGNVLPPLFEGLILASQQRELVLSGKIAPSFPTDEPPFWASDYQSALAALSNNNSAEELAASLENLNEVLDGISGQNENLEFEGFRNCDSRLAPVLEAVIDGVYTWVPLSSVFRISVPARPDLAQDLVWCPVILMLSDNEVKTGHLFTTYPGTSSQGSTSAILARTVEWDESHQSVDIGRGLQMFYLGEEPTPLFSLGQCSFQAQPGDSETQQNDETA